MTTLYFPFSQNCVLETCSLTRLAYEYRNTSSKNKEVLDLIYSELQRREKIQGDISRMLSKHQWSGTAYGSYKSIARKCPECGGIKEGSKLNYDGGDFAEGKGHKADCLLASVIIQTQHIEISNGS